MQNNFIAVNKEKDGEILQVILEFKSSECETCIIKHFHFHNSKTHVDSDVEHLSQTV